MVWNFNRMSGEFRMRCRSLLFPLLWALLLAGTACGAKIRPITAIFMLDSSASSYQHRADAIASVKMLTQELQRSIDHVAVYRLNNEVNNLYTGDPIKRDLRRVLDTYLNLPQDRAGTAYGTALLRGLEEAKLASRRGDLVALFVLGDGADETVSSGHNLDDGVLTRIEREFPKDGVIAFLYADPKYSDRIYKRLHGVMDTRFRSLTPQTSKNMQIIRELYGLLGR